MANSHYKHKDYSKLLKELQKKSNKQNNNENCSDTIENIEITTSLHSEKSIELDYDLDTLLGSINSLQELITLYTVCEEQVEYEQQITQDLLHAIEFSTNYKERCKYATQLHYNRQRRRVYKNTMIVLKSLVDFIQKEENVKVVNKLTNILGEARKIKLHSNDKSYSPRILTELGVFTNGKNK